MIRAKLSLRRSLAVAGAAVVGLSTAFAVGAPAIATPSPSPSAPAPTCVSAENARYSHTFDGPAGKATIKLLNGPLCEGEEQEFALVSYVAPSAKFAVPQYALDKSVQKFTSPAEGELSVKESELTFAVEVPTCFTQVDFVFGSEIIDPLTDRSDRYGDRKVGSSNGIGSHSKGKAAWYNGGEGSCEAAPEVVAASDCKGEVELTLVNRLGNAAAEFVITGSGGHTEKVSVPMRGIEKRKLTAEQAKSITVTVNGKTVHEGGWAQPAECEQPEIGEPETSYTADCEWLTLKVVNPKNGVSLTSTFTPSTGTPKTVTFEPDSTETVQFPAAKGLTVTVTGDLESAKPIAWTAPEGGCADGGGGSGGGDQDGGLPVTGPAAGGIAAGAALLLAVGVVFFVVARRRRIRFTA